MTKQPTLSEVRKIVFLLPVWQLLVGVVIAILFFLLQGMTAAIAGFFGASISFAGSMVFALVVFSVTNHNQQNLTRTMFRAEALKMLVIAVMFYAAFALLALPFMPVIVGFMATLIVFFVALLTVFK